MAKHFTHKHLLASLVGFTVGYIVGVILESLFGWHAYVCGLIGSVVAYYALHSFIPSGRKG